MTMHAVTYADTVVVGGGSAGAAVAARIAERSDETVLLLEAGPDYGAWSAGAWPSELLDASQLPLTHEWGLSTTLPSGRRLPLERARVIGGCSSHNGCQVVFGHRSDYDAWAQAGNPGWATEDLLPCLERALERLRVRRYERSELTPFARATLEAFDLGGVPWVDDINDLDETVAAAANPANIVGGVRFNSAFAYLDPVRDRPNLTVAGGILCDRLILGGGRVVGVAAIAGSRRETIRAGRVVLCAGAYCTPAILQRSGIGDPAALAAAGVEALHELPGVGENLQDHPAVELRFAGTPELVARTEVFAARRFHPEEQVVAKLRSARCDDAFDLQVTTQGGARRADPSRYMWEYMAAVLQPLSRGSVRVAGPDPERLPDVDHAFLTDPEGRDAEVLADGLELMRELCAREPLASLLGAEILPGPDARGREAVLRACREGVVHAYHPGGTCKMGPAGDPGAVVDAEGRVHGLEGAWVADASVMPTLPRANTHLPVTVVAERIADFLTDHVPAVPAREGETL